MNRTETEMKTVQPNLTGENLASVHEAAARKFVEEVTCFKEITGVVLLGGAARGFADKHSDIDVVVFINKKDFDRVPRGERTYGGYDLDTIVLYYPYAKREDWSMEQRWAYSAGKILYDPNKKIEKLLKEKMKFTEEEKREILVENIFFLAWYGINYKEGTWRGYDFSRKPDFWVERGDIESAHYILNKALDMVLDILYITNDQLIPDEKWKIHFVHSLGWLPTDFEAKFKEAMLIKDMTPEDFEGRLKAIESIYKNTTEKIEKETDLLPGNIYQYLLDHSVYYKVY